MKSMEIIQKIKLFLNNNKLKNLLIFLIVPFSFMIIDVGFRYIYQHKVPFIRWNSFSPNLFMLSFLIVLTIIIYFLPKKASKITYLIIYIFTIIFVIAQSIHMETLGRFFGYSDLMGTKEGAIYFKDVLNKLNQKVLILVLVSSVIMLISSKLLGSVDRLKLNFKKKVIFLTFALFISLSCYTLANINLGTKPEDDFEKSVSIYDAYHNYKDNNKSIFISGIYFYCLRNPYVYIKENITINKQESIQYINEYFEENKRVKENNQYTNYFKDKNLIYIMLESIDTFLVDDEYMPTLNYLKNTGWNFNNHYAPTFGSGYTFNTEFALNTGLYSPVNGGAYSLTGNNFITSLPNLFKKANYSVNSVHQNYGKFYNRTQMHLAFGYDNHYDKSYMINGFNYQSDESLVQDENIYNYIAKSSDRFMTFITTYSAHIPYGNNNNLCKANEEYQIVSKTNNNNNNSEISCIKTLAKITDNFIKELIDKLEKDKILDNTVLILTTDHYMYGIKDKETLYKLKNNTEHNLLSKVPFIIWSKDILHKEISTLNSTIDLLPTIANLFGLEYNPNYYLGNDIFSKYYSKYVYFSDNTWVDENNSYKKEEDLIEEDYKVYNEIKKKIEINDLIIKTNYYNYLNNSDII